MRVKFLLALSVLLVLPMSAYAESPADIVDLAAKLNFNKDDFRGVTFVTHPLENAFRSRQVESGRQLCGFRCEVTLYPYIGYDDSSKWMFLRLHYRGSRWLLAEQVYVLVNEDRFVTPVYSPLSQFVDRGVTTTGVHETIHFRESDAGVGELIRAVAAAGDGDSVRVRFSGSRGNIDFALTPEERTAWKEVLDFYEQLDPALGWP